jgi:DNA-binding MarR family transcriptional regulator
VAPREHAVLEMIVHHLGDNANSNPSIRRLAAETCLSVDAVHAAIKVLEEDLKLIRVERKANNRNRYFLEPLREKLAAIARRFASDAGGGFR